MNYLQNQLIGLGHQLHSQIMGGQHLQIPQTQQQIKKVQQQINQIPVYQEEETHGE